MTNPILEEIYAAREKLLAGADGDIQKYLQGVRQREQASGRLVKPQDHDVDRPDEAAKSRQTISKP